MIGVDLNDSLNVRDAPRADAQIIGTLARWSTGVAVTEDVESGDVGTWRRVGLPSGIQGWVNARSLVAQPRVLSPETRQQLVSLADTFVAAALDDGDAPDELLSPLALWVGGIGIYADGPTVWNWIPVTDLAEPTDWTRVRTFDQVGGDFDCGIDCDKSLNEFLRLARLDAQTQTLVNDIPNNARGLFDGLLWDAPESLHRVVFDKPNTADMTREGANWQRIHLVLDWSTGKPLIALINTHGWTP